MSRKSSQIRRLLSCMIFLVFVTGAFVPRLADAASNDPIKMGFSAPLTSIIKFAADRAKQGAELATKHLNDRGGILGRKVEMLYGDTRLDPNEAINIARRFILQEKVSAYFGDFTSSGTLAIIDIVARANIPQITYTNATKITRSGYKHVINLKPNSDHLFGSSVAYAVEDKKYKNLAVLALDDEYGKGNVDAIRAYIKKFGGAKIVAIEWYRITDKEFRPLLTKLARSNPDAFVLTGSLADTALAVKQYGELGLKIPLVGDGGHSLAVFRKLAGSSATGMIVTPAFWPGFFKNKAAVDFHKSFNAKYGVLEGDEWSNYAYDAVMMVAAAMERAKSTDGAKVIPELFKLGEFDGASGKFRITPNGEIDTKVFIGEWASNGKIKLIRSLKPPSLK